jgi:hypothetical protein
MHDAFLLAELRGGRMSWGVLGGQYQNSVLELARQTSWSTAAGLVADEVALTHDLALAALDRAGGTHNPGLAAQIAALEGAISSSPAYSTQAGYSTATLAGVWGLSLMVP